MTEKASKSSLTFKLITSFVISITLIGFAAYFAFQNFNKLLGSVETLSEPNNTTEELQEIVNIMHEADGNMRSFIMTNDYTALQNYMVEMEDISIELENLKQDQAFAKSEKTLDSLGEYFQDKADLMYSLVIFKQSSEYEQLNAKAMQKISSTAEVTDIPNKISQENTVKEPDIKQPAISKPEAETKKNDKKNKKKDEGFLTNLFSGKNRRDKKSTDNTNIVILSDTVKNESSTSAYNYQIAENPSLNMEDVRKIFKEIDDEQKRYNTQLTKKELEILASDKIIIKKINEVIERIQIDQLNNSEALLQAASANAKKSSRTMLYIGSAALFIGIIFMGVILIDIKRSNRYKVQLIEARNKAEYLAKAKEEFLANMSHEIRTPLNAIIGFSEQLENTSLKTSQRKYLRAVSNAGAHLLNTVNDILDLSKIEAGKLAIDEQPFVMKDVIEEIASILEIKAQEKGLQLNTFIYDNSDEWVVGDPFRVKQILYNITGNAIKFTEKGFVEIKCEGIKGKNTIDYRITITDSGIGIPADKLEGIFESFEQAEKSTSRKYGGTGLGLSISKKIAELLNGKITVTSEGGKGSAFTVLLPMRIASSKEKDIIDKGAGKKSDLHGLEILIVDDEPFNLMLAEIILNKHGAHISVANNGRVALEKIEMQSFDIVLADLHMPEVDGYMLANKIREQYLQVPLIALTANVMQNDLEKIRQSGFNDILLKPYKEKELLNIIAKYAPVVIGENTDVIDVSEQSDQTELYDLDEIKRFSDNDNSILVSIIESFIHNNSLNLFTLKDAVSKKDFHTIRNTAHKMLPSYNHFHVFEIIPELKQLEIIQDNSDLDIWNIYNKIEIVSKELYIKLDQECNRIKVDVY